jgi:hypothetical protein
MSKSGREKSLIGTRTQHLEQIDLGGNNGAETFRVHSQRRREVEAGAGTGEQMTQRRRHENTRESPLYDQEK